MTPMQRIVLSILKQWGMGRIFETHGDVHLRLENEPWLPLVVERHGFEVSIAHYREQNGDLVPDPEMTFSLRPNWLWKPLTINPGGFGEQTVARLVQDAAGRPTVEYSPRLLREAQSFARVWAQNLRAQGFLGDAVTATSFTHPNAVQPRRGADGR